MAKQITIQNDIAHQQTDDVISELEEKIRKEYEQAAKETEKKWKDYLAKFEKKDQIKQQQLADGKITKDEYTKWRTGQIAIGKRWDEMRRTLATDLANSSEICRSMTEGYMPGVYALNHDYATFLIEADSLVDTSYTLYDRQAVERLIRDNPKLMPTMSDKTAEKIRKGELIKWNEEKLTSSVTQGILQGESIPHLAQRLRGVAQMDYNASIRNARTMIGNAESAGRIDSMKRAEDMGIKMQKRWLSTLDNRTRHEHMILNGQTQDIDDPFIVGEYKIMYPCDSGADPAMVYNCRCDMISVFAGYDKQVTDYNIDERLGGMTYEEWRHSKDKPKKFEFKFGKTLDGYNKDDVEMMQHLIRTAPDGVGQMYSAYSDQMQAYYAEKEGAGAWYSSRDDMVHLNAPHSCAGDDLHAAYQTHFHEYGHNIDYKAGYAYTHNPDGSLKEIPNGRGKTYKPYTAFSEVYKSKTTGKTLEQTINGEWQEFIHYRYCEKEFAENFDKSKGGMGDKEYLEYQLRRWRLDNGISRDDLRFLDLKSKIASAESGTTDMIDLFKSEFDVFGYHKDPIDYTRTIDDFCNEIRRDYNLRERGDLSDMFEKFATKNAGSEYAYPFGAGHGVTYARKGGSLPKEAFAEMTSATVTNPQSLNMIKEYLPKSHDMYLEMVDEATKLAGR